MIIIFDNVGFSQSIKLLMLSELKLRIFPSSNVFGPLKSIHLREIHSI